MAALAALHVPQISHEELFAFHESHFSHLSTADFGARFTSLPEPASEEPQEDGIEAQEVERQAATEVVDGDEYDPEATFDLHFTHADFAATCEDGEIPNDGIENGMESEKEQDKTRKKRRRRKNNTGNSKARRHLGLGSNGSNGGNGEPKHPKPDLRKRTWDVVDTGLGSLDYDGAERGGDAMQSAPQRRRVQYGDECK
ncbi:uncharacterized protein SPSK_04559 [Sporothrix schenckii 1099-18]|uniref:Uncharacterized protein n=1 Tax=Sporothrix schenckii 1099-18 TaxID=1397361 RepID=A0A0F2M4F3_SPOSC|nr:uncharacterized protein SPSK_04559 [Sporothrix schenckii 1099-18]KJR83056.1 hypothetical protein SPSK_04559 [Sporothrix schenckii 1099-18]